jgi:hypothetical protein
MSLGFPAQDYFHSHGAPGATGAKEPSTAPAFYPYPSSLAQFGRIGEVEFVDDLTGFAVGDPPAGAHGQLSPPPLFESHDGGMSWTEVNPALGDHA